MNIIYVIIMVLLAACFPNSIKPVHMIKSKAIDYWPPSLRRTPRMYDKHKENICKEKTSLQRDLKQHIVKYQNRTCIIIQEKCSYILSPEPRAQQQLSKRGGHGYIVRRERVPWPSARSWPKIECLATMKIKIVLCVYGRWTFYCSRNRRLCEQSKGTKGALNPKDGPHWNTC